MSFFGKNVKKIRTIKQLSQQEFGEIFDIKRATLGAYEEGRSLPKIETIIKVAQHFNISIDDILTKELTVNELLQFKSDFTLQPNEILIEKFAQIPCITEQTEFDYIHNSDNANKMSRLPKLSLPLNPEKKFCGLTITNLEMTKHDKGFLPKDVVVGEFVPLNVYEKLNNGTLVFIVTDKKIIFRRLYYSNKKFTLRADHRSIEDIELVKKEILEMWRVRYVFYRRLPEVEGNFESRLDDIQQELAEIKDKL